MALPEAVERESHGEPTWFAGQGKVFAMLDSSVGRAHADAPRAERRCREPGQAVALASVRPGELGGEPRAVAQDDHGLEGARRRHVFGDEAPILPAQRRAPRSIEDDPPRARPQRPPPGVAHEGLDAPAAAHQLQVVVARHDQSAAVARRVIRVRSTRAAERRVAEERQRREHEPRRQGGAPARRAHAAGRRATSQVTATMKSAGA